MGPTATESHAQRVGVSARVYALRRARPLARVRLCVRVYVCCVSNSFAEDKHH